MRFDKGTVIQVNNDDGDRLRGEIKQSDNSDTWRFYPCSSLFGYDAEELQAIVCQLQDMTGWRSRLRRWWSIKTRWIRG